MICDRGIRIAGSLAAIVLGAVSGSAWAQLTPAQPNIVFMISDDHRWDCIGAAGNPNVQTPNLDQLASEGMYFRQGTIAIPSCSVSRATILTGMPPHEHRWYSNELQWQPLIDPDGFRNYTLLPKVMKQAGYHTAFTGKWHLRPEPWNCGFNTIGKWMIGGMGPYRGPQLAEGRSREKKKVTGFAQTIFANEAISILNGHVQEESDNPLFLWLSFTAPHAKFQPVPAHIEGMYNGKTPRQLAPPTFRGNPADTKHNAQNWPDYYEAITHLDEQVGRVMNKIRTTPELADNTVVVFLGDNGFMMGEQGLHGKYVPYDASARVPFIVWGPDSVVGPAGVNNAQVSSLDLPPTFAKMAGSAVPSEWRGRDMTPVLADGQLHGFTWSVTEYPDHITQFAGVEGYRMIRTAQYKLIMYYPDTDRPVKFQNRFFDLVNDPGESNNLYNNPSVAAQQAQLQQLLDNWRSATNDTTWEMQEPLADFESPGTSVDDWELYSGG